MLGQGLYLGPYVSCPNFLPKILTYFSKLKMQKLTIISWAIYRLVSCRVIYAPSNVQCVYRSPKRTFILTEKYRVLVTNILEVLKYVKENKNNTKFKDQTW